MAPPPITTNPPVQTPFANEQEEQKTLETLQTGQPEQVRQTVDGLTPEQTTQLQGEVGQLPVTQQRDLANNVAKAGLSAEQLAKVKPVLSEEVLDGAIAAYGSPETRTNYKLISSDPVERAQGELQKEVDKVTAAQDQPGDGTSTSSASRRIDAAIAADAAMAKYRDLALSLPPDQAARFVVDSEQQLKTIASGLDPTNVGAAADRYGTRQDAFAAISRHVSGDGKAGRVNEILAENAGARTSATGVPAVPTEMGRLRSEVYAAEQAAKDKDNELATLLAHDEVSGRMSDEELKQVVEHFRNKPENAAVYNKLKDAQNELGEYTVKNSEYLLALAKQPGGESARTALVDGLDALASGGREVEAAAFLDQKILSDPALSQKLREENKETFDKAMEGAFTGAAVEIAKSLGTDASPERLAEAFEAKYSNLFNNGFNAQTGAQGASSFRDAFKALAAGDASKLAGLPTDSPVTRALAGAGAVFGVLNAANHAKAGDPEKLVYDSATATAGLLTAMGKLTSKGVPILGVVANGAAIADVLKGENLNAGDAGVLAGSVMGLIGSGLLIGGSTGGPAGAILVGGGAVIAAVGGIISNQINEHRTESEIRKLLEDSGIPKDRVDRIIDNVTILAPGPDFGTGSAPEQPTA